MTLYFSIRAQQITIAKEVMTTMAASITMTTGTTTAIITFEFLLPVELQR